MPPSDTLIVTLQRWMELSMRHTMRNFVRYTRDIGLSMPQIGAMFHLSHKDSSVRNLGEHLGVSNAAASQMLERLVQQGLISRVEDPNDRRFKQIALTSKGQQVLQNGIQARQDWLNELARLLSEDETQLVRAALELLIEKARQLDQLNQEQKT